jgi:hypothetical protein
MKILQFNGRPVLGALVAGHVGKLAELNLGDVKVGDGISVEPEGV